MTDLPPAAAIAIVPAAGASRRMERPKLLLPYGAGTVLGSLVAALRAGGAAPIVVVAAAADAGLRAWSAGPCSAGEPGGSMGEGGGGEAAGVLGAVNPDPERGMLSSILAGLAALGGAGELAQRGVPLLVTPGDLPALRAATVAELLRRRQTAGAGLAVPVYRGRRGHPLIIAPELIPAIERLDPARGLRQLLDLHPDAVLAVAVDDPGCVADLDTPQDYENLRRRGGVSSP